jgi:hypothetical protein
MTARVVALALLLVPAVAHPLTIEGKTYENPVTVEGHSFKLVGGGIREKWFFNVYALAAYSESGTCSAAALVNNDEPKYLRLDMLRNVSAEKMSSTIGGSFDEHMPKESSPELRAQRATFQGYFKEECSKGSVLEFVYLPGTGTILRQNGKQLGAPIPGPMFAHVLWDIYFGEETCCAPLKKAVLSCGK